MSDPGSQEERRVPGESLNVQTFCLLSVIFLKWDGSIVELFLPFLHNHSQVRSLFDAWRQSCSMAGNQTNFPGAFLFLLVLADIELFLFLSVSFFTEDLHSRQFAPNLAKSRAVTGWERMAVDTLSRYHFCLHVLSNMDTLSRYRFF